MGLLITDVGLFISELSIQMKNWVFKYRYGSFNHAEVGLLISELGLKMQNWVLKYRYESQIQIWVRYESFNHRCGPLISELGLFKYKIESTDMDLLIIDVGILITNVDFDIDLYYQ